MPVHMHDPACIPVFSVCLPVCASMYELASIGYTTPGVCGMSASLTQPRLQVPQAMRPVVASLSSLYNACAAAVAGQPSRKREMDNNAQRLGVLFWHLNAGSLSPGVADALRQICAALDARDYNTASTLQVGVV